MKTSGLKYEGITGLNIFGGELSMTKHIKVKLNTDLSRYGEGLLPGIEGYTIGQYGIWSRSSDRFIGVCFPGIATLDVLWQSLEIIDDEYLSKVALLREKEMAELKSARNVIKYVGPRGGFRRISYEYICSNGIVGSVSNGFKKDADKLIEIFNKYGINVEIKTIR